MFFTFWGLNTIKKNQGSIKSRGIITHEFPLHNVKEAFERQTKSEEAIKVLVKP